MEIAVLLFVTVLSQIFHLTLSFVTLINENENHVNYGICIHKTQKKKKKIVSNYELIDR